MVVVSSSSSSSASRDNFRMGQVIPILVRDTCFCCCSGGGGCCCCDCCCPSSVLWDSLRIGQAGISVCGDDGTSFVGLMGSGDSLRMAGTS